MKWRARWYFIKPQKKFFPTYSVLEESAYHLIVAISVELPICQYKKRLSWSITFILCPTLLLESGSGKNFHIKQYRQTRLQRESSINFARNTHYLIYREWGSHRLSKWKKSDCCVTELRRNLVHRHGAWVNKLAILTELPRLTSGGYASIPYFDTSGVAASRFQKTS